MSPHSPLSDAQFQHNNVHSSHNYPTSYLMSSSQRNVAALDTMVGQTPYLQQPFPWPSNSQNTGGDFTESPTGTPYSENGSFNNSYYLGQHSSQTLGYPESSQRTHVPDSSYSTIYPRFDNSGIGGQLQSSSHDVESLPQLYHGQRHFIAGQANDLSAQGQYPLRGDAPNTQPELRQVPPQRGMGSTRTGVAPQLGGYPSQSSLPAMLHGIPTNASLGDVHSAPHSTSHHVSRQSLSQYPYQPHPNSIHRFGEPGSPSVVPPLIFDGETGEELDDGSECASASSDASRSGDSSNPQYSPSGNVSRDDWNAATMDDSTSFEIGSPSSEHATFDAHSPTLSPEPGLASPTMGSSSEHPKSKKSKMHQCTTCLKWFPRPSGLATHMNSHSGARPYKCPIPTCTKSFAVRSNAKRHLRTHGIFPTSDHANPPAQFTVGFDVPIVSEVQQTSKLPTKLRWVPQSLATRTNVDYLRETTSDSEDEFPPSCPVLSVPLPAVVPSSPKCYPEDRYEDRNSYDQVGTSPYLSSQWRSLPGPAIVSPPSL
ncbi:hypothetical protein NLI96_g4846 [Meripilus lineatus]|uniref:C2H2-type domain-containing protein n=1 Tax=Meripilus lineatus TaxID=2056292 RepID=A0AAD5V3U2_9APHY|nr:hypothetical protein NLI96_g4846 [Physisporinus lineatus]